MFHAPFQREKPTEKACNLFVSTCSSSHLENHDFVLKKKTWPCPLNFVECYFLSHVWMAELECKERERQRTDAFELWCWRWLLRVPWTDCKEIQPVILKKISPEYSLEGLMLEVKLQYFRHLMRKNWLIGKDPDAGKDWRQEEKGMTEDEIVGWHHWLNGPAFG